MFRNGFPGSFPTKKSNPLKRQATITHNVNNITKLNQFMNHEHQKGANTVTVLQSYTYLKAIYLLLNIVR